MADSFIPAQDPQALIWMQSFANTLSANVGTYFISAADAATISSAVAAFAAALAISSEPSTRTPVTINDKDEARNAAEQVCRQFAILIKYNAGIGNGAKIAAGVRPVNPDREPIECPQSSPALNVVASTPGSQTLRYTDALTPDTRAKPFGATELQLFCVVGEEPATNPDNAKFMGKFTKNPVSVEFGAADNGKQATYFARWSSRKGEVGPWSLPVSMAIAA